MGPRPEGRPRHARRTPPGRPTTRLWPVLLLAVVVGACERAPRQAAVAPATQRAVSATQRAVAATQRAVAATQPAVGPRSAGPRFGGEPAAATLTPPCRALVAKFERAALAATNLCQQDQQCACYGLPWLETSGRVADSATAAKLGEIRSDYLREGCPLTSFALGTPPPPCVPRCVGGRCTARR